MLIELLNLLFPSYNQVTISFFRRSRRKIMSPEVCLPPSIFFNFFIPYNGTTDPRNAGRRMFRRGEGFTRVIKLDAVRGLPVQWGRKYAGLPHAEKHGSSFRFRNWRIVNVLVGEKVQARVSAFQNFCPTRVVFTRSFFSFFFVSALRLSSHIKGRSIVSTWSGAINRRFASTRTSHCSLCFLVSVISFSIGADVCFFEQKATGAQPLN